MSGGTSSEKSAGCGLEGAVEELVGSSVAGGAEGPDMIFGPKFSSTTMPFASIRIRLRGTSSLKLSVTRWNWRE